MLLTPGVISGLLWSLASLIILSDERGRGEKKREGEKASVSVTEREEETDTQLIFGSCSVVAAWRRRVSQWQRSKNKIVLIRFSKCLHPLLVELREEDLLDREKLFLFY